MERAAILCEGGLITAEHLRLTPASSPSASASVAVLSTTDLNAVERDLIRRVLSECRGTKSLAATRLGLSRTQLYVRLRKHQLS